MDKGALALIGNTPLIKLQKVVPENGVEIWLKFEAINPTGSYKDRMALSVLKSAMDRGDLHPGDTVVEYTGGSTGSSLAFVSAVLGLKFVAVFSDAFSNSKQQTMEAFGAHIVIEESWGKGITPELLERMKKRAMHLCNDSNAYYANQFGSPDVMLGYQPMGREIAELLGRNIDTFCAAVGTAGALMGVWQGLAETCSKINVIAFEPTQSPLLTTGKGGAHRVEGIGVGFYPPFLDSTVLTDIRTVDQEEGFAMCQRLAKEEGIFCGGSTGLNVVGAIALSKDMEPGQKIVTLACDSGLKYLGGHIYA
ncbi:MAG: cysteine synthase [Acidiferrobacteraceae bacterium]|nr:cysteine synthase [Acidiferrobacteraceae bacterium]|tara:strand:+ start:1608 stop:2531 length:924 start_codon:yes stop_codon:yes gene_type:complete